ncbi:MAG: hypothetical protein WC444_01720 [Candidatus Paceibacterota bacterium]
MQDLSSRTFQKLVFAVLSLAFFFVSFSPAKAADTKDTQYTFSQARPLSSLILTLRSRPFTVSKLAHTSFSFAHTLPKLLASQSLATIPKIAYSEPLAIQKINVPNLSFTPSSLQNIVLAMEVTYTKALNSITLSPISENKLVISGATPREVGVAGTPLALPFVHTLTSYIVGTLHGEIFSKETVATYASSVNTHLPRLAQIELLPHAQNQGVVLGAFTSQTPSGLAQQKKNLPFLDQLSLSLYCKLSSLSSTLDQKRCNYTILASGLLSPSTNTTNTVAVAPAVTTPTVSTPSSSVTSATIKTTPAASPIYLTKYITEYVPVAGPAGANGRDGRDGQSASNPSLPTSFGGFITPTTVNQSSTPYFAQSLIGVSTIGYLRDTTIEYANFNYGTSSNMYLANATLNGVAFSGSNVFTGSASFSAGVSANTLTASSSTFGNSTTTNAYITNLSAASSTLTDVSATRFLVDNATATNAFIQNLVVGSYITNGSSTSNGNVTVNGGLVVYGSSTLATTTVTSFTADVATTTNLIATSATTTNLAATNASTTNASSTNFFATNSITTNATSTNGFFANLWSTLANITDLIIGNSTTTNAIVTNSTTTNAYVQNLVVGSSTSNGNVTVNGELVVVGTSTFATTTATSFTANNATSTNGFFSNLWSTLARITDLIVGNSTTTNAIITNATSTNLFASNLFGTNATTTNFFSALAAIVGLEVTNSTTTNAIVTNSTTTNAYINNLVIGGGTLNVNGQVVVVGTSTLATTTVTNLSASTASTTNLTVANGTTTNLVAVNASTTNATTTNAYIDKLVIGGGTLNVNGQVVVVGTSTFATTTATSFTATSATSTNGFFSNLWSTLARITDLIVGNSTTTNAIITNATSTNLYTNTFVGGNATTTNLFSSDIKATNGYISGGFGVGVATTAPGVIETSGNVYIGGSLNVAGSLTSSITNGQIQFLAVPFGTGINQGTVYVNPTSAGTNNVLLGLSVAGAEKARIDAEGDVQIVGTFNSTNTTGTNLFSGNLTTNGNTILGDSSADTVTINGKIASTILPSTDLGADLGSPTFRFGNIYAATTTISNLVAGGTASSTFIINTGNFTNDTQDSTLEFSRGIATPNAVLKWNSTLSQFEFNNFKVNFANSINVAGTATSSIAGMLTLTGTPLGTGLGQGSLYINPGSGSTNSTLLGVGVNGVERFRVDAEGDTTIQASLGIQNAIFNINTDTLVVDDKLQLNGNAIKDSTGTTRLTFGATNTFVGAVDLGSGALTTGLINGQTISSAANFTGTLGVTGQTTLSTASSSALTANTLYAIAANLTNASTTGLTATSLYTTNLLATYSTSTNISSTNGSITSLITTSASTTNLSATGATFTNTNTTGTATITNASTTNLSATGFTSASSTLVNATSSNFFATILNAITATFNSFTAGNITATSSLASNGTLNVTGQTTLGNASTTNLSATGATLTSLFSTNATLTNATTTLLAVTGTSTLATTTISNLTVTGQTTLGNASTTNISATGAVFGNTNTTGTATILNASTTNLSASGLFATNAFLSALTVTNASTTNISGSGLNFTNGFFGGLTATNVTFTNASTTNLSATGATLASLFSTNATITNASTTNLSATGATLTNAFVGGLTTTNASTTNVTTSGDSYFSALTSGSIPFISTGGKLSQNNANFFWDNTNTRLGIGTATPASIVDIYGTDALRLPVGTTVQRPSLAGTGQVRYNVTTHQFEGYGDNAVWQGLGGVINPAQTTYITAGVDDYLRFVTSSVERMTIASNGNVGVGTTSPIAMLSVMASSTSLASPFISFNSTTSPIFNVLANGDTIFGKNVSQSTASPLNVSFGGTYGNSTPGSPANLKWTMYNDGNPVNNYGIGMSASLMELRAGASASIGFFPNNGVEAMRIISNGNVGIGTTNPVNGKLEVTGDGSGINSTIRVNSTSNSNSATVGAYSGSVGGFFRAYGSSFGVASLASKAAFGPDGANGIVVFSNAASASNSTGSISLRGGGYDTAAEKLYIDKDGSYFTGNVGIGTTNPGVKLDVAGTGSVTGSSAQLRAISYSSTYSNWQGAGGITLGKSHSDVSGTLATTLNGEGLGQIGFSGVNTAGALYNQAVIDVVQNGNAIAGNGGPARMDFYTGSATGLINTMSINSGNVGIGTTTPAAMFAVNGNSYFAGNVTATGTLNVTGQTTLANASTTNLSATGATLASLFSTNATITNASTTNLSATGATLTNLYSTSATVGTLSATSATLTNASTTGLTATNLYATLFNTTGTTTLATAGGNVGVGTSTPSALFDVNSGGSSMFKVSSAGIATFSGAPSNHFLTINGNSIKDYYQTTGDLRGTMSFGGGSGTDISIAPNSTSGVVQINNGGSSILSGGPSAGSTAGTFTIRPTSIGEYGTYSAAGRDMLLIGGASSDAGATARNGGNIYLDGGAPVNAGIAGNVLLATTRGNVGIGTSSPTTKFAVNGDSYFAGNVTATGTFNIAGQTTLSNASSTGFTATNLYATLFNTTGTTTLATAGGNVGIGTSTPSSKLHVVGDTKLDGNLNIGANSILGNSVSLLFGYAGTLGFSAGGANPFMWLNTATVKGFAGSSISAGYDNPALLVTGYTNKSNGHVLVKGGDNLARSGSAYNGGNVILEPGLPDTTFLGTTGNTMINKADGTEAMRINGTSGYVGIGTTTPAAMFAVNGNSYFAGNVTATGTLNISGQTTLGNASTTNLSATGATLASLFSTNATITNASTTNLSSTGFTGTNGIFTGTFNVNGQSTLATASSTGLTVTGGTYLATAGGRVGIGTTAPGADLQITSSAPSLVLKGLGNNDIASIGITSSNGFSGGAFNEGFKFYYDAPNGTTFFDNYWSGGDMVFRSQVGYTARESMRVTSTGNLGVGTSTPYARLGVKGAGTGTGIAFQTTGSTNIPGLTVLDNGYVGIGTTSPASSLSINGGTVTATSSLVNLVQTWNQSGSTFSGLTMNITDTASLTASNLVDLQVGGISKFSVRKDGRPTIPGALNSSTNGLLITNTDGNVINFGSGDNQIKFYKPIRAYYANAVISGNDTDGPSAKLTVRGANLGSGQDAVTSLTLHGGNASPDAVTNITGGILTLTGGNGSSGSAGLASGGNITLDGGLGYGTGISGNIILGGTRGNVGIGTTTPLSLLSVSSSTATGTSNLFSIATSTSIFNVLANGNVGIGSSTPGYALDVFGTVRAGTTTGKVLLMSDASAAAIGGAGTASIVVGNSKIRDNQYGIDIYPSTSQTGALRVTNESLMGGTGNGITFQALTGNSTGNVVLEGYNANDTGIASYHNILFGINRIEKARFDINGNLGLGTTTFTAKLAVNGDSYFAGNVTATGTVNAPSSLFTNSTSTNLNLSGWFRDSTNATGTSGQALVSTGTSTLWSTIVAGSGVTNAYASSTFMTLVTDFSTHNLTATGTLNVTGDATLALASSTALTVTGQTILASAGGYVGIGTTSPVSPLSVNGGTVTATSSLVNLAQTWNQSGSTMSGLTMNITDTASLAASNLVDLQVGGVSKFSVRKDGAMTVPTGSISSPSSLIISGGPHYITGIANAYTGFFGDDGAGVKGKLLVWKYSNISVPSNYSYSWSSGLDAVSTPDLFLSRKAAANLQLGGADAASPVAQTFSVQSVVAGTTNTAGTSTTFKASAGTGTGLGGAFIFQTAAASSTSGTFQNAFNTAMTILGNGNVGIGSSTPSFKLSVGGDIVASGSGGSLKIDISGASASGTIQPSINSLRFLNSASNAWIKTTSLSHGVAALGVLSWSPDTNPENSDTGFSRISAGVLGLGNGSQGSITGTLIAGNIGIGTTTPTTSLFVQGVGGTNPFNIASSTGSSLMMMNQLGALLFGTTTYAGQAGEVYANLFTAASSTATSTFAGNVNIGSGGLFYNASTSVTSISNLELGNLSFDTDAGIVQWTDLPILNAATGTVESYSAAIAGTSVLTVYGESNGYAAVQYPRVGINMATPLSVLDAYSATSTSNVDIFRLLSDVGGASNVKFRIDSDGDVFTDGGTTIGTPADLAENYPALEAVDAGTVVAFGTSTVAWGQISNTSTTTEMYDISGVRKALTDYEAIGVISTKAGITLGGDTRDGVPVAFSGRIPVKVTTENGEVKRGDFLTVSKTMPGYAMKMTGEGRALGRAISDFVQGKDRVMMLIENGNQKLDLAGRNASTTNMLTTGNVDLNANGVAITNIKSLASANGTWSIDENGRITAKTLCLEDVCIDKTTLTNLLNASNQSSVQSAPAPTGTTGTVAGTSTTATPIDTATTTTTIPADTATTTPVVDPLPVDPTSAPAPVDPVPVPVDPVPAPVIDPTPVAVVDPVPAPVVDPAPVVTP